MRSPIDSFEDKGDMYAFDEFCRLMGFERVWQFEREHAETTEREAVQTLQAVIEASPAAIVGLDRSGEERPGPERMVSPTTSAPRRRSTVRDGRSLVWAAGAVPAGGLACIATDGETYGHHHRFGQRERHGLGSHAVAVHQR